MIEDIKNINFRAVFDALADAMLITNNTGHVLVANTSAEFLFGYKENELIGLALEMLIAPRYRKQFQHHQTLFFKEREKPSPDLGNDIIAINSYKQEMLLDMSFSTVEMHEQPYLLIKFTVSTQRKKVEDALRISEERLRLAKQAANIGIFDYDFKSNTVFWDKQMCEFWGGYSGKSISYEGFVSMIHPDDRAKRQAAIDYAMDPVNHGQYKAEYRVIDSMDGTERTISVVGRIYFENGCANRLVGIAKDVTEHKNFQKKLRTQRNEIEEISKQQVAVRTASAIAHELNQPLAAISAYSEVIMHELQKDSINIENLKKMLGSCVKQAQRAGRSLHELIAFLQKGEQIAGPFDLNKIILEVLEIISNDGYERFSTNLNLEKHLPTVKCNTTQIQKVFFNLIRNALEAMQSIDSPILTITTKSHFLKGKNFAIVIVQDNGPGFDPLITKHIFEPFYTTKSSGIGMGLAISRALIETNGGMLWVESPLGNGTKFYFTLPLSQD